MEYRKFGDSYVVRLDKHEEIVTQLTSLCQKENISLGSVTGLGCVNSAKIGVFDTEKKVFLSRTYEGMFEIADLTGSVTTMNGAPYLHLHITIGSTELDQCISGHLAEATISGTAEIIIHAVNGRVEREFSPEIGLNLLKFE